MSFNRVVLVGRLTKNVEVKTGKSGISYGGFSLAVNERYKGKDSVDFINCKVFGKTSEVMGKYLGKGSEVLVEGKLKVDKWEGETGIKTFVYVLVERFSFIGDKNSNGMEEEAEIGDSWEPASNVLSSDSENLLPF